MSEVVPQGRAVAADAESRGIATGVSRRGRFRWVVAGSLVILVAGGLASAWYTGAFKSASPSGTTGAPPPATYTVARQDISSTTPESATLGYAGSYTVTGQGGGTLTWLPSAGEVIRQGQVLYRTDNGTPTVLLYGSVPAWENMSEETTGEDVTQLNHDLVDLGYASGSIVSTLGWDYYSWQTSYAVQQLEEHLGVPNPSGSLSLGSVVFEPEALRVSTETGTLGSQASGPVFSATSDRHVVTISLSTSMEGEVTAGDAVSITLPNGSTTPGVVTSVGTVASGSSTSATIPVYVKLTHPSDAGTLDQAPVTVNITTGSASDVLVVEVGALLAQPSGGYAVEVVGAGNTRRLVPVTVGIFDDASGLVHVTGNLTPGERVVVPQT
ncbi:MAG: efflux RND transporter periplasmic adaptor subunit [Streptosporangiaceae bacterium]|jgi:multidrug efflux pump subunit AcrA (membrane-fusion protein)